MFSPPGQGNDPPALFGRQGAYLGTPTPSHSYAHRTYGPLIKSDKQPFLIKLAIAMVSPI